MGSASAEDWGSPLRRAGGSAPERTEHLRHEIDRRHVLQRSATANWWPAPSEGNLPDGASKPKPWTTSNQLLAPVEALGQPGHVSVTRRNRRKLFLLETAYCTPTAASRLSPNPPRRARQQGPSNRRSSDLPTSPRLLAGSSPTGKSSTCSSRLQDPPRSTQSRTHLLGSGKFARLGNAEAQRAGAPEAASIDTFFSSYAYAGS